MNMLCVFFNDTATPEIYTYRHTLSLHDALPISGAALRPQHVDMGGVVEAAVAEIILTEHAADQDQGRAGALGGTHLLADVGERAADDELVGPGGVVDHGDRPIFPVMRGQRRRDVLQVADGTVAGGRRAGPAGGREAIAFRPGRSIPGR